MYIFYCLFAIFHTRTGYLLLAQTSCGVALKPFPLHCNVKRKTSSLQYIFSFCFSFPSPPPPNFWINIINISTIWLWYCCYDTEFKGLLWGPCFAEKMICTITTLRVYVQHELSTLMIVITSSVGLFQNFYIPYNQTNFLFFLSSLS